MMTPQKHDLTRITLGVLCTLLLISASMWVLRPFLAAGIWATMIVVATWPLFISIEKKLRGKRSLAIAIMTLAMLLLMVLPLWLAIDTIVEHAEGIANLMKRFAASGLPQAPNWLNDIPLVGHKFYSMWSQLSDAGPQGLFIKAEPYAAQAGTWILSQVGSLGALLIQFLFIVMLSGVLFATGEVGARNVRRFGQRLGGERGENAILLAGGAIRGVALGIGVTAIVQTLLGAIGLAIAGVPFTSLLSALMLMMCIAQLGPLLVMLPATAWMFWSGDHTWAIFLFIWSIFVGTLDNFLRPTLIKKGADLPLLLIFAGVIGGMLSFGLIGLFIGPVVLGVTYTLLQAWIEDELGKSTDN